MELVSMLTRALGVNESQSKGGAGLLFRMAKEKLGGDFGKVSDAVPGMDGLLAAAPAGGGLGGALGGGAGLAGGFSKLGLDPGMAGKFILCPRRLRDGPGKQPFRKPR